MNVITGTIIYLGNFKVLEMNAAGKRVFANAKLLEKCGYHVVLIGNDSFPQKELKSVAIDGIEVYSFESYKKKIRRVDILAYFKTFKEIIQKHEKVSHIICYGSPSLSLFNLLVIRFANNKRITVVTDVVDWLSADSGNFVFRFLKQTDINFRNGYINTRYDKIIVISQWLKEYYSKYYDINKIIVIPPLIYNKPKESLPNNTITELIYAGVPFTLNHRITNLSNVKDRIDIMLKLLRIAKERGASFHLSIYGFTKEQLLHSIPSLIDDVSRLNDSVCFFGKVPMKTISKALEDADYTIFFRNISRTTMAGFPTKIVESLSAGVPVITTKTTNIEDYVNIGTEVFYLNLDREDESIETLMLLLKMNLIDKTSNRRKCYSNVSFYIDSYIDVMKDYLG